MMASSILHQAYTLGSHVSFTTDEVSSILYGTHILLEEWKQINRES